MKDFGGALSRYTILAFALLLGGACSPEEREARPRPHFEDCVFQGVAARCTKISVWENYEQRAGRQIELRVAVLPARGSVKQPDAVFFLAGGPGQGARGLIGQVSPWLAAARRERDLVFFDQRGTGGSNPLNCRAENPDDIRTALNSEVDLEDLRACRRRLDADLTRYTTWDAAQDIEQVRAALGYSQVNLVGVSYGTRLALKYLEDFPEQVRSLVLDGLAPAELKLFLDFYADGQRALDLSFSQCEASAACNERFPNFRKDLKALLARHREEPLTAEFEHPATFEKVSVEFRADSLALAIRGMLYSAELRRLLPLMVEQLSQGKVELLITQTLLLARGLERHFSFGLLLATACSEDLADLSAADIERAAQTSFLAPSMALEMKRACTVWPAPRPGLPRLGAISSQVPTLVFSGELDPATPPVWADQVLPRFPKALHLKASGLAHGVLGYGCAPKLTAQFLSQGNHDGLDASCIETLKPSPFFLTKHGPGP